MRVRTVTVDQVLALRQQVLWPDQPKDFCRVEQDQYGVHYAAMNNARAGCTGQNIIGVASLFWQVDGVRLRKFAVHPDHQRTGVGSQLMRVMLADIAQHNQRLEQPQTLYCDARESAVAFYRRFGMRSQGERFFKQTEPYYRMVLAPGLP